MTSKPLTFTQIVNKQHQKAIDALSAGEFNGDLAAFKSLTTWVHLGDDTPEDWRACGLDMPPGDEHARSVVLNQVYDALTPEQKVALEELQSV